MLSILNSGLTGVERGAYRAARSLGIAVTGYASADRRDEFGALPADLDALLLAQELRGPRRAQVANIQIASGVLLVVPDAARLEHFTAMRRLAIASRNAGVPLHVCDPCCPFEPLCAWVVGLGERRGSIRLFVTGPRETRWPDGEYAGRRITSAIALALTATVVVGHG